MSSSWCWKHEDGHWVLYTNLHAGLLEACWKQNYNNNDASNFVCDLGRHYVKRSVRGFLQFRSDGSSIEPRPVSRLGLALPPNSVPYQIPEGLVTAIQEGNCVALIGAGSRS